MHLNSGNLFGLDGSENRSKRLGFKKVLTRYCQGSKTYTRDIVSLLAELIALHSSSTLCREINDKVFGACGPHWTGLRVMNVIVLPRLHYSGLLWKFCIYTLWQTGLHGLRFLCMKLDYRVSAVPGIKLHAFLIQGLVG